MVTSGTEGLDTVSGRVYGASMKPQTLVASRGMIGNRSFHAIHTAEDGITLCGIDVAFAQQAGKYEITFPKVAPFKYQCTLCRRREIEGRA